MTSSACKVPRKQAAAAGGRQPPAPPPSQTCFLLLLCTAIVALLLAPTSAWASTTPDPRTTKAQLYQDTNGNLHISSSANQSVFVNDINVVTMAERIRHLEEANDRLAAANANASLSANLLERRLAVLEAIAASNPGSLTNSTTQPNTITTTPGPRTTLPPAHTVNNGSRVWSKVLGSPQRDIARGVAVDKSDFVYICGHSNAYSDKGFGGAYSNGRSEDGAVVRLTSDGSSVWTKLFGTSNADRCYAIATDSTNNVFCAGSLGGSLDGQPYFGNSDLGIVKLNNNGIQKWSRQVGSSGSDQGYAICVDKEDNVIAAGYTNGGVAGNLNVGGSDNLLIKYNGNGDLLWLRQFGTASSEYVRGMTTDSANNIYITGSTNGRLVEDTTVTTSTTDLFVAKYDKDGVQLWVRQLGSDEWDECVSIALDSFGSIYVACNSVGDLDGFLNVGFNDAYVVKFDPNGTKVWSRRLATIAEDYAQAIAVDSNNFVYVAGYTHGGLEGNVNLDTSTSGTADIFVAQYDSDGTLRWLQQYGSVSNDIAYGIAVDSNNAVYVTGYTHKANSFDDIPNTNIGSEDVFITKLV